MAAPFNLSVAVTGFEMLYHSGSKKLVEIGLIGEGASLGKDRVHLGRHLVRGGG